jgi:AraC-like DNA-binding protein
VADARSKKNAPALLPQDATRVLARAERIGGVAIALFQRAGDTEGKPIAACGSAAEACKYVSRLPWGKQACRRSRERALALSQTLGKPAPFICHMGFACAACAVTDDTGAQYALAIGPYCPSEAPDSLEADVIAGLQALERDRGDNLPFSLEDIPTASATAVPELLGWTAEWLMGMVEAPVPAPASEPPAVHKPRKLKAGPYDPYQAADIASALAGANQDQARAIVKTVMSESGSGKRLSLELKKARAVSMVGAVLEAGARAGLDTSPCWDKFGEFERAVRGARSVRDLVHGAMKVLGALKRSVANQSGDAAFYQQLNNLVARRITEEVTLAEVARLMNVHPTAVTHRLQRKFGMSFSEYRARIRVDMAKELLRETQLKVREVALRVGINDTGNFGKIFRKFERMSPLDYRARNAARRK